MRQSRRELLKSGTMLAGAATLSPFLIGCTKTAEAERSGSQSSRDGAWSALSIQLTAPWSRLTEKLVEIIRTRFQERCGVTPALGGQTGLSLELGVANGIGNEGFRIEDRSPGKLRIVGNDEKGLLFGVGKFLRSINFSQGSFSVGNWRGTSVPSKPVRGIYFATHFNNFYDDGPVDDIRRYIEDLSLWGVNALSVAYDMHSFAGIEDPAAKAMLARLRMLLEAARRVGMGTGLMLGANQAYSNSPKHLRAVGPGRGEFNKTDLCPRKPGAKELLLKQFSQEFEVFSDIGVDYITIWPYDASSCGCKLCHPWGSNGFLYISEAISRLAHQYFPNVRLTLATWYFDENEWQGLEKAFRHKPDWVDFILADPLGHADNYILTHPVPGGLPLMGFPEISMAGMYPWGGFGANPQPARFQREWHLVRDHFQGGFPYSEGIYEDINKVIFTQFYWKPDRDVRDTLQEYVSYEFSPSVVTEMTEVIEIFEKNHHYRWWPGGNRNYNFPGHERWWKPAQGVAVDKAAVTKRAFELVHNQVMPKLPTPAKLSWRWRIVYLRALLDEEFRLNPDQPSERAKEAIKELVAIYHATGADRPVRPSFQ